MISSWIVPLVLNWYTILIPKIIRTFPLKSRAFIVLHLTFRSMIYLELKSVTGIRSVSRFIIFLLCRYPTVPAPIVEKDHLFFIVLLLLPCQR